MSWDGWPTLLYILQSHHSQIIRGFARIFTIFCDSALSGTELTQTFLIYPWRTENEQEKRKRVRIFLSNLCCFVNRKKTSAVITYISLSIYVIFFAEKLSLRYLSNTCNDKNKILSGFGPVNVKNGFRIRIKRQRLWRSITALALCYGSGAMQRLWRLAPARALRRAASLSLNYGSGAQLRLQME